MNASQLHLFFMGHIMASAGPDIPVPVIYLGMALVFAGITAVARWFGAGYAVAIGITCVPLALWCLVTWLGAAGRGHGAVPMPYVTVPILLTAAVSSGLAAYFVPQRKKSKGAKSKPSPKGKKPPPKKKKK